MSKEYLLTSAIIAATMSIAALSTADAKCPDVPYALTNGQIADATHVARDFDSVVDCVNNAPAGTPNSVQYNAGDSSFGALDPLSDGQLFIGSTNNPPHPATLTAGPGITITNGPGSVTISGAGTGVGIVTDYGTMAATAVSTSAFAYKGNPIYPLNSATIMGATGMFAPVSGASYKAYLVQFSPANGVVVDVLAQSDAVILSGTSEAYYRFMFTSPAYIVPGNNYTILIGRSDASGTYAFPIRTGSSTVDLATAQAYNSFSLMRMTGAVRFAGTAISVGSTLDMSILGTSTSAFSVGLIGRPGL